MSPEYLVGDDMLYFAYGSCMEQADILRTCGGARFLQPVWAPDVDLRFTRFSPRRAGGVADIVPIDGCRVWGALYEIPAAEVAQLDQREGYRGAEDPANGYERVSIQVRHAEDQRVDAHTYTVAKPLEDRLRTHITPSEAYLGLILQGAAQRDLPEAYIAAVSMKARGITSFR